MWTNYTKEIFVNYRFMASFKGPAPEHQFKKFRLTVCINLRRVYTITFSGEPAQKKIKLCPGNPKAKALTLEITKMIATDLLP